MRFGGEVVLRKAMNEDWSVIITEYQYKGGKIYCRTHINFKDSNSIHEPFEELCERYRCEEEKR